MFEKVPAEIENASDYWKLVDHLHKKQKKDTDAYYQTATQILFDMSPESKIRFAQYTCLYMSAIEECIWLDMACKAINDHVSDDTSLYFTLWVLSRGKQTLLAALNDPDSLSALRYIPYGQAEFEMFMDLGEFSDEDFIASERENLLSEIIFRGGDKFGEYSSFDDAMEEYEQFTPQLVKGREKFFGGKCNMPDMSEIEASLATIMSQIDKPTLPQITSNPWNPEDIQKTLLPSGYTPLHGMMAIGEGFLGCSYEEGRNIILTLYQLDSATEKELLRIPKQQGAQFIFCGCDKVHFAFTYNEQDDLSKVLYLYEWLSGTVREIIFSEPNSQLSGGSLHGDMLYLSVIVAIRNPRKMKRNILNLDISTEKFTIEVEEATNPAATENGLYYVRLNKDFRETLMFRSWEDEEPREIRADIQNNYSAYRSVVSYVALEPDQHVLPSFLYLYQNGEEQTLLPHVMVHQLTIGGDNLLFTIGSMGGNSPKLFMYNLKSCKFYEINCDNHIYEVHAIDNQIQWTEYIYDKKSTDTRYLINRLIV